MNNSFEKKIRRIFRAGVFNPEDGLSQLISEQSDAELYEEELELVAAATKVDYEKFLELIELGKK